MTKELFIKYLQGNCTESEFEQILVWIKEEATTTSGQDIVNEIWNEFEAEAGLAERIKYNRILDKIHHQINISQNSRQSKLQITPIRNRILLGLTRAAAILLIPVLSLLIYTTLSNKDRIAKDCSDLVVEAPLGSRVNFELSDGTRVWLNHGSKLKYPYRFDKENRKVLLTGEAYFAVAHNENVPFIVGTDRLSVKATGTEFNVSAYPEDNVIETTLVEGRVIIYERKDNKELIALSPNECLKFNPNKSEFTLETGNTAKYTAWKEGRLVFRNDSLAEIARKLSRWYNVDVEIINKKAKEFTYTATFTNETLSQVLELMTLPAPVSYKLTEVRKLPDGSFTKQKVLIGLKKNN
jgi:transmembrane sensor